MAEEAAVQPTSSTPAHACKHHFDVQPSGPACKCQRLLWPRRIHALLGLLLTCFLVVHLSVCAVGLSPAAYQNSVDLIDRMLARIPGFVLLAIFLPFALQAGSGLFLLKKEGVHYNVNKCSRGGKLRFFLQRMSALAILLFMGIHVATLHEWGLHLAYRLSHWSALARYSVGGLFTPGAAFPSTVIGFQEAWKAGNPVHPINAVLASFSLLAVWATAYHAANGAWTGGIIWKFSATKVSKSAWNRLCITIGAVLALLGSIAWYAFILSAPAQAVISFVSR